MHEVVVVAVIKVKPEALESALDRVHEVISATHAEQGCLRYALHRDRGDPTRFVLIQKWANMAAFEAHERPSSHMDGLRQRVEEISAVPVQTYVLEALPFGDPARGLL